ncbi:PilZ domain-containing protein [Paenibacillus sp. GCM10023252]|uniref:PilZ domain-containing protein n=1 Tax=Paenibacillus sp. GCM10023252 TaxID=3252649 RepID=UPI00361BE0C9
MDIQPSKKINPRPKIRLKLTKGVQSNLQLLDLKGSLLTESSCTVHIQEISQDGLTYVSDLRFPVREPYMVRLQFEIAGIPLTVCGRVSWRHRLESLYEHGIRFYPVNKIQVKLLQLMNEEVLRRNPHQSQVHKLYQGLKQNSQTKTGGNPWN